MTTDAAAGMPWRRDRGLAAIGLTGTALLLVLGLELLPTSLLGPVVWPCLTLLEITEVVLCLAVLGRPTLARQYRRFWIVLTAAPVLFAASSAVQTVVAVRHPLAREVFTGAPAQVVLVSGGALALISTLLSAPLTLTTRRERQRFWLDALTVMLFVGILGWLAVRLTPLHGHDMTGMAAVSVVVIVPTGFVVTAFGAVRIVLGGAAPVGRAAGRVGSLAAIVQGASSALGGTLLEHHHPAWKLSLGALADLTFLVALRIQLLQLRGSSGGQPGDRGGRRASRLPYLALAASFGILVGVLARRGLTVDEWVVLLATIASSGVVVLRQLAAFADNDDLLTQRDELAGRLREIAYHDGLTGLANRSLFLERLEHALTCDSGTGRHPTVLIMDLDEFKPVNDRYGHQAGDALLRAVAHRLRACVRPEDTVARLGGDEFAILVDAGSHVEVPALVRRLAAAVREPVEIDRDAGDGVETALVSVRASIGVATAAGAGDSVTGLLHRADLEMYADKQLARPSTSEAVPRH